MLHFTDQDKPEQTLCGLALTALLERGDIAQNWLTWAYSDSEGAMLCEGCEDDMYRRLQDV